MIVLLLILALVQPVQTDETERLAATIVELQPKAVMYARPLANAIFREAAEHGLDPTVLAAVVWMESWFDDEASGGEGERGLWQIHPATLREWRSWPRGIDAETRLGAAILATFVRSCRRRHRDHRRPTDAYAHYNSGFSWPRPGYSYKLWQLTKHIRRAIGRPAVTDEERAWMGRMVR